MKIKMIDLSAGPGGVMQPGQQYEVTDDVAKALLAGHHAVLIDEAADAEEEQPENEVTEDVANDAGKGKTVPGRNNK